jgi:hypothetical protein
MRPRALLRSSFLQRHVPDKQGNKRDGFVAVVGLTPQMTGPISGPDQVIFRERMAGRAAVREATLRAPWPIPPARSVGCPATGRAVPRCHRIPIV